MFNNLNVPQQNVEKEVDTLGSSVYESGLYRAKIEQAYGTTAQSGAMGVVLKFQLEKADGSKLPYTSTFWVTNKEGSVTYQTKDGKTHYLQGFNQINSICEVLTGKQLMEIPTEERTLMVYNFEQRQEVATKVQAIPDLFGKEIALGLLKTRENKNQKVGNEYVPTAEEIFRNNIDKVFFIKEGNVYTSNEIHSNAEPKFAIDWVAKWKDKTQDRYKAVSGSTGFGATTTTELDIG